MGRDAQPGPDAANRQAVYRQPERAERADIENRPPHGAACFLYLPSPHAQAGDKLLGGSRRPARAAHLAPREVPSRGGPFFPFG